MLDASMRWTRGAGETCLRPAGIALGLLGVLAPMAVFRLVDADEGTFVLAARLVMEGALPHHDFFYPYTPLLPYVYGGWRMIAGESWYAARALSVVLTAGIGVLVYVHAARVSGRTVVGAIAVTLWCFHGFTLGWLPLVKTYTLSTFLLVGAVVLLDGRWRKGWAQLAAGGLIGLAIGTRFYVGVVAAVLLLYTMRAAEGTRDRVESALRLALGVAVALAPNAAFALAGPDHFLFNVVGVHAIRSEWGLIGNLAQKAEVALTLVAPTGREGAASFQFTVLLALTGVLVVARWRRGEPIPVAAPVAAVLAAASFAPTPVHAQYFCAVVPFLGVTAALGLHEMGRLRSVQPALSSVRPLATAVVVLYVGAGGIEAYRYTVDGMQVPGVVSSADAPNWRIVNIEAVTREMEAQARTVDGRVLSWWPGYFGSTRLRPVPRLENHNGLDFAERLGDRAEHYRFMSETEMRSLLSAREVEVVVLGNWAFGARQAYRTVLSASGYRLVRRIVDTEIYRLEAPARSLPDRPDPRASVAEEGRVRRWPQSRAAAP